MKLEPVVFTLALENLARHVLNALWGARHLIIGTILCFAVAIAAHAEPVESITQPDGTILVSIGGTITTSPTSATF